MQNGENIDAPRRRPVEDQIGKTRHDGTPDPPINHRMRLWKLSDVFKALLHRGQKLRAKPRAHRLVPLKGGPQVVLRTVAQDDP